jgi:hypothetical protein
MKGIIGAVRCDAEACPQMFLDDSGLRTGHADAAQAGNDAERKAAAEGWSIDMRGKVRHYCPNHTAERKMDAERRAEAFQNKPTE